MRRRADATLSAVVADRIRAEILAGRYRPQQRLVEESLSADLGVSRVPIREALRRLAAEGLVEIQPRRGARVASMSARDARELVEVRAMLEGMNARLAARRREPPIERELARVLAAGRALAQREDDPATAAALASLNASFHELLARAGANSVLGEMMRNLRERTALLFSTNTVRRAREDWQEHAGILEAVIAGDEELAALLAQRHVLRAAAARLAAADDGLRAAA